MTHSVLPIPNIQTLIPEDSDGACGTTALGDDPRPSEGVGQGIGAGCIASSEDALAAVGVGDDGEAGGGGDTAVVELDGVLGTDYLSGSGEMG
jgi:hypothetical protein